MIAPRRRHGKRPHDRGDGRGQIIGAKAHQAVHHTASQIGRLAISSSTSA